MLIKNVKIYTEDKEFVPGEIAVDNGKFADPAAEAADVSEVLDGQGCYMIPGLVDIHFHGCVGDDFCDAKEEAIANMAKHEASVGVTSICPATMTLSEEELHSIMKTAGAYSGTEGAKLAEDLIHRGNLIRCYVDSIGQRAPKLQEIYAGRLVERIKELLGDNVQIPEERIAMEAAIFADKSNITEELVRLDSHMLQMKKIIESDSPEGKKLDFLVQEMNREANTIGSKANDLDITSIMLEIKSEVEKIREQVQNIE